MAKQQPPKLPRERAKELLTQVDALASMKKGKEFRERVVKLLRTEVPTYSWVGIYLVSGNDLLLDAWSGPQATEHLRIPIGKGVCGFAAKSGRTEIVSDVSKDSRYLACFLNTRSEIVVPILLEGKVVGEIDIDGDLLDSFTTVDKEFLEAVARKLAPQCNPIW
jgi:L-methionine (R)-S-oxide reductase